MKIPSTQQKILKLSGLVDTKDLTPWQNDFIKSIVRWTKNGEKNIDVITDRQLEIIDEIHDRNFS